MNFIIDTLILHQDLQIQVRLAKYEEKAIVRKLLNFAFYDYSEFNGRDLNMFAEFDYKYLDNYWTEENRFPYIMYVNGKIAGFALVRTGVKVNGEKTNQIAEFLVMRKYRNQGVGKQFAFQVFENHPGLWYIDQEINNIPAQGFWHHIIKEFTKDNFYQSNENEEGHPYQKFNKK